MREIMVSDAMSDRFILMAEDVSLNIAVNQLVSRALSCIFVERDGLPVGIVTERDLCRCYARSFGDNQALDLRLGDLMTSPLVTVNIDTTLDEALTLARTRHVRHLPVLDPDDKLVGVLTQSSMLNAYMFEIQRHNQVVSEEVRERTEELNAANQMLAALAMQDGLLGIGNRRAMEVDLKHTQATYRRYGSQYSIALLDIDYFKKYNDCYGHLAGDEALRQTVDIIQKNIRASDRIYRYGGEEFLLLLPDTDVDDAIVAVNQIREAVRAEEIENQDSRFGILTISAGVAQGDETDWLESVSHADEALYLAKENGRDRVQRAQWSK